MSPHDYISSYSLIRPQRLFLRMRQQPINTRTSTNNERDRRAIDPPPIVQIQLQNATPAETLQFLQSPNYFMCANLAHPYNDDEIYTPNHNALCGQTVSSMYRLKDIDNLDGGFFILGDLSVKVQGQFRLKLTLFEITSSGATNIQSIFTDIFTVYSPKQFPGPLESTFLSRSFSDQGARIRIRKEHQTRKRKASFTSVESNSPVSPPPSTIEVPTIKKPCMLPSLSQIFAEEQVDAAVTMMQLRHHPW
ncbi:hypothetical protein LRAMOSA10885 [Lichtheimia ramosa]|uniref:Velvet domain-containing protein n=1 Tax=Lichtheimia ramosa TaxID=688394 RepID=A0A077WQ86_9FUNG|nr:hypothetical protein LRAMOSA10885 [Lichtheimia ramosa]